MSDEPRGVGVLHAPGRGRDDPRNTNPDCWAVPDFCVDRLHQMDHSVDGLSVVVSRRRNTASHALAAVIVDRNAFDLRPTQIDADSHEQYCISLRSAIVPGCATDLCPSLFWAS